MGRFSNRRHEPLPTLRDILRWRRKGQPVPWPKWVEVAVGRVPDRAATQDALAFTLVNHSTVLVGAAGRFFLTDPIWSERASPLSFAGPKRVHAPGLDLEGLPELHGILLSHNHYDHCDRATLRALAQRSGETPVYTGLGNARRLHRWGFSVVHELDWWESAEAGPCRVHYTPTKHFAARGLFDRCDSLWGGFVLETPLGRIYFAGDTAAGAHDAELARRFGSFRVALLPIGAYEPRWLMRSNHMHPAEAVATHQMIGAQDSVAIHHGTFAGLTDEGRDEPVEALGRALAAADVSPARFQAPAPGTTLWFPPSDA